MGENIFLHLRQNRYLQVALLIFLILSSPLPSAFLNWITSESCHVPELTPFDIKVMAALESEKAPKELYCQFQNKSKWPHLFDSSTFPSPRLIPVASPSEFEELEIESCYYQTVLRLNETDQHVDQGVSILSAEHSVSIVKETPIPVEHSVILVSCYRQIMSSYAKGDNTTKITLKLKRQPVDVHMFAKEIIMNYTKVNYTGEKINVVILGIESVSRMAFKRDFILTSQLLKQMDALEMTKYHKIGDKTFPNVAAILTNHKTKGESSLNCEVNKTFDGCPLIWRKYGEAGYKTLYAEDVLHTSFSKGKEGFVKVPTHFYMRPLRLVAHKVVHDTNKATLASRCIGPRPAFQVMFDYMQKVTEVLTSKKENYFQFGWTSSTTEGSVRDGALIDKHLYDWIEWWRKGGHLNNTILILTSSHGARTGVVHGTYQGLLEDRLPVLFFLVPQNFKRNYPWEYENLKKNQQRLTATPDLYATLDHILKLSTETVHGHHKKVQDSDQFSGISLFKRFPSVRSCSDAGVDPAYCTCNHKVTVLPVEDTMVQQAVHFAVYAINKVVSENKKCAYHNLKMIESAGLVDFPGVTRGDDVWKGYQVAFTTNPGESRFKALVQMGFNGLKSFWRLPTDIERLGDFEKESSCVTDSKVKKYCYCSEVIDHDWNIKFY